MRRRAHLLTPLTCVALLLAGPVRADATEPASAAPVPGALDGAHARRTELVAAAERLAEAAFEAYQQQQYQRAIELYQQAWAAAPSADIAFNIARIYDRGLHDALSAIDYYERCVAAARASPQRRLSAERRIAELQAQLVSERAAPSGTTASASVAAASVAAAPVAAALPVAEPTPNVAPAATAASARAAPHDVAASAWTPREVTALILGGAGVSALGVGLGFALSANGERAEWQRGCDGNACSSQGALNAARSAGRKADIASVALASGAGLLGIGAALWLIGPTAVESTPRAELRIVPTGRATDLTWTLLGRF